MGLSPFGVTQGRRDIIHSSLARDRLSFTTLALRIYSHMVREDAEIKRPPFPHRYSQSRKMPTKRATPSH